MTSLSHDYYVYITTNPAITKFYTGLTKDLTRTLSELRQNKGMTATFAGKHHCYHLIYYEHFTKMEMAIQREKQIKLMPKESKLALIRSTNPQMLFLYFS